MTISGSVSGSTTTDANGSYAFSVPIGATYVVTPSKQALKPGGSIISTLDALGVMSHYLGGMALPCPTAGDITGDTMVNSMDVVGIQRFTLGYPGSSSCGQYRFTPFVPTLDFTVVLLGDVL